MVPIAWVELEQTLDSGGPSADSTSLLVADAAARAACRPIDDKRGTVAYRTKVSGVLLKRTVGIAAERARGA